MVQLKPNRMHQNKLRWDTLLIQDGEAIIFMPNALTF